MDHVTRPALLAAGWTDGGIARAVRRGELSRVRSGHFALASLDELTRRAIHVGGRLACVSELRRRGVWVLDDATVHVHVAANASRQREDAAGARRHWRPLTQPPLDLDHVDVVDALIQARDCLDHRAWVASVDSALNRGDIGRAQLNSLLSSLPATDRPPVALFDGTAQSGLESIARVIATELGFRVRSQVKFAGVGRVDLVVENWIVVETDGSEFHDVELAAHDRARDAVLAAQSMTVLRPGYSLVVFDPSAVARQLIGAVRAHRRVKDSGRMADRATRRLPGLGLA